MTEEKDVAEQVAKEKALENMPLTTSEDMLEGYATKKVALSTGRVFEIEGFLPSSLMINTSSPLLARFLDGDEDAGDAIFQNNGGVVGDAIKQLVSDHVVNVPVSMQPQWRCAKGVVSIDRFELTEIKELFKEMCALSGVQLFSEAEAEN
ncbi:MAG: hypothetical protein OXL96_28245 [Candidatus Poribacteria bacterium]|nr:hypothetical protein [Candidatus Poribacteria bacterium]